LGRRPGGNRARWFVSLNFLWIVLIIALILWVLGFFMRGTSGGRWYRW
jgi:hypothetical protein